MVSFRKYTGALAISTLLGCSVPQESKPSDYVTADLPTAREEALLGQYDPRPSSLRGQVDDVFRGNRVIITYKTNDGPGSKLPYSPVDSSFVDGVQNDLMSRGAHVLRVGNPTGNYTDINFAKTPGSVYEGSLVVVADRDPNISGVRDDLLNKVYTVSFDAGAYKFRRVAE